MRNARASRSRREPRRRPAIDLIVELRSNAAAGVRDAGKMDDLIGSLERRPPVEGLR